MQPARLGIGGNNPPEPIEDDGIRNEVTLVWGAIEELKVETAEEAPDKSRIDRIIATLSRALVASSPGVGGRVIWRSTR